MERFGDIIVSAQIETQQFIVQRIFGREDNNPRIEIACLQLPNDIQSTAIRQHNIDHNQVIIVIIDFLTGFRHLLTADGLAVLEMPYLRDLVERLEYDTIYHEHLSYFSVNPLIRLCEAAELSLVKIDYFNGIS